MSHRLRFCTDCPDHEACATGASCHQVKTINDLAPTHSCISLDDDMVIPVSRAPGRGCDDCGSSDDVWLIHADGGPGTICRRCRANLNWSDPVPITMERSP